MQRSVLTMADTAEQWYSWQDDIFLRYPDHRNTPAPPVHWALSLYWSVIQQDQPLVDADVATAVLEQAVALNPWVGEPQIVLAQLCLTAGEFEHAEAAASSGLQMLASWGTAWDKRIGWDAWLAWGRILLQGARTRNWPERLDKLNNLALSSAGR